jgi:excisionase family DNA binding protein
VSTTLDGRLFLTVREARNVLGISSTHLYRLVAKGKLRISKTGKRSLVPVSSIRAFAAELDPASVNEAA